MTSNLDLRELGMRGFAFRPATVSLPVVLLIIECALSGCASVAVVRRNQPDRKSRSIPGIPFYARVGYCIETTAFERDWVAVSLAVERHLQGTREPRIDRATGIAFVRADAAALQSLREAMLEAPKETAGGSDTVLDAFIRLRADPSARIDTEAALDPTRDRLVASSRRIESKVDYETVHFINSRMPWFGTSKLEAALANDGSLTKAVAESESKAAEAIASLVPMKEFLTSRWVPSVEEASESGAKAKALISGLDSSKGLNEEASALQRLQRSAIVEALQEELAPRRYRLDAERQGYRWVRRREWRLNSTDSSCVNTPKATLESIERSRLVAATAPDETANKRSILFEGSVRLPESEGNNDPKHDD